VLTVPPVLCNASTGVRGGDCGGKHGLADEQGEMTSAGAAEVFEESEGWCRTVPGERSCQ
jgi:hypothetical protein